MKAFWWTWTFDPGKNYPQSIGPKKDSPCMWRRCHCQWLNYLLHRTHETTADRLYEIQSSAFLRALLVPILLQTIHIWLFLIPGLLGFLGCLFSFSFGPACHIFKVCVTCEVEARGPWPLTCGSTLADGNMYQVNEAWGALQRALTRVLEEGLTKYLDKGLGEVVGEDSEWCQRP